MKLLFTFTGSLDPLMQQMAAKYERYRQWLAKIMGKDPETFSDKEIKVCMKVEVPDIEQVVILFLL